MNKDKKRLVSGIKETIFLGHCAISPLYSGAADAMKQFVDRMSAEGINALPDYFSVMPTFHANVARFLKTSSDNISYIQNTAEGLCQIANGYPFEPGDQIISYQHEYPSNHYPWLLQKKRGVELRLLSDVDPIGDYNDIDKPKGWSMDELVSLITDRTRIIAVSHVQFSSGYAADLKALGRLCKEYEIDLVVDCAQSLGCLPVYPEEYNIAAIASSAWKWLMGPKGSALLYTSKELREKLNVTMAGPGLMKQGLNYLDLHWAPHTDGQMFEYSTLAWDHVAALNCVLEDVFLDQAMETIRAEVIRLQDILIQHLDLNLLTPLLFEPKNRSGIIVAQVNGDVGSVVQKLLEKGVTATAPIGYLRLAPHFYQEDHEMVRAAKSINEACYQLSVC